MGWRSSGALAWDGQNVPFFLCLCFCLAFLGALSCGGMGRRRRGSPARTSYADLGQDMAIFVKPAAVA